MQESSGALAYPMTVEFDERFARPEPRALVLLGPSAALALWACPPDSDGVCP